MNRFFCEKDDKGFLFSDETLFHIRSVLRLKKGEVIQVVADGSLYEAKIASLDPFLLSDVTSINEDRESSFHLAIGFSLLKGGHDDFVVMKGTEMGVEEFFPLLSRYSIISLPNEKDKSKKSERYRKIALSSSEQSKRLECPFVHDVSSFSSVLKEDFSYKYIAYEGEAMKSNSLLKEVTALPKGAKVLVLVGPEGGWSEEEVKEAEKSGFKAISLGKRILRAESASIYVAALLGAFGDEQ